MENTRLGTDRFGEGEHSEMDTLKNKPQNDGTDVEIKGK